MSAGVVGFAFLVMARLVLWAFEGTRSVTLWYIGRGIAEIDV
jgi:hypothetical protein